MKILLSLLCLVSLSSAVCAQGLDAPGKRAYDTLARVSLFAVGGIGVVGSRSSGETALRVLLKEKGGGTAFQKLLQSATPEGKLYGLLGLSLVAPGHLSAQMGPYLASKVPVQTASGCMMMTEETRAVAHNINNGEYRLYFTRTVDKPPVRPKR